MQSNHIIYWDNIELLEKDYEEIISTYKNEFYYLLTGEYKRVAIEKLTNVNMFSIRVERSGDQVHQNDRLMFFPHPTKPRTLVLTREGFNHNYDKLNFLEKIYKEKITQDETQFTSINLSSPLFSTQEIGREEDIATTNTNIFFGNQIIELNSAQESVLKGKMPLRISGIPGSGKSCVLSALLTQTLLQPMEDIDDNTVFYIAENERLVADMQEKWNQSPLGHETNDRNVIFITYNEFLDFLEPENKDKNKVDADHCKQWLIDYIKKNKTKWKNKLRNKIQDTDLDSFLKNIDGIYQELRLLSGYSKKQYSELGERQCTFSEIDKKEILWEMKSAYLKALAFDNKIHPAFYRIKEESIKKIRSKNLFIAADEIQDLSTQQLGLLAQVSNQNICFCGDTNQGLFDTQSFQQTYLLNTIKCDSIVLPYTYRCGSSVAKLANRVIKIKNFLTAGSSIKNEQQTIEAAKDMMEGHVEIMVEKSECQKYIAQYQQRPNTIVITTIEQKKEAEEKFGKGRVFTPEEVKGLEYQHVILYQFFNSKEYEKIFKEANSNLENKTFEDIDKIVYRAKSGCEQDQFRPALNELFTAITRAKESVTIIDSSLKRYNHFYSLLKISAQNQNDVSKKMLKENDKSWLDEAKALYKNKKHDQAMDIYNEHLDDEQKLEFKNFMSMQNIQPAKGSAPINSSVNRDRKNTLLENQPKEEIIHSTKQNKPLKKKPTAIKPVQTSKNLPQSSSNKKQPLPQVNSQKEKKQVVNNQQAPVITTVTNETVQQNKEAEKINNLSHALTKVYGEGDCDFISRFENAIQSSLDNKNYALIKQLIFDIKMSNGQTLFDTIIENRNKEILFDTIIENKNKEIIVCNNYKPLSIYFFRLLLSLDSDCCTFLFKDILTKKVINNSYSLWNVTIDIPTFIPSILLKTDLLKDIMNEELFDINSVNTEGNTLLHQMLLASMNQNKKAKNYPAYINLMKLLINDKRIDINKKNINNQGYLELAVMSNCMNTFQHLVKNPDCDKSLILSLLPATVHGNDSHIFYYLYHNYNINVNEKYLGETALHVAIRKSNFTIIKLLCENPNIDFKITNEKGETAVQYMESILDKIDDDKSNQRREIFQYLLEKSLSNSSKKQAVHLIDENFEKNIMAVSNLPPLPALPTTSLFQSPFTHFSPPKETSFPLEIKILLYRSKNGELAVKFPDERMAYQFLEQLGGRMQLKDDFYPKVYEDNKTTLYFPAYTALKGEFTAIFPSENMCQIFFNSLLINGNQIHTDAFMRKNNANEHVIHFKNNIFFADNGNISLPVPACLTIQHEMIKNV